MRYEFNDDEWRIIKPMLPNKSRGVPRVDDRRVLWLGSKDREPRPPLFRDVNII
jgi:hypothetical protein